MKRKIFCIFPYGYLLLACVLIPCLIGSWFAIATMPRVEAWVLLGLSVICWIFILFGIKEGYTDFLFSSSNGIKHNNTVYSWDNVFITMDSYRSKNFRYTLYMVYFSDHFLSKEEINSKSIRKETFYMALTKKRLQYLLNYYDKKIRILDTYATNKKLLALVEAHNNNSDLN